ncbi:hypothetical protein C7M84_007280 [Penaeus vannamei]|uniref:Uncharacterized protein n=1 Tax=Penaeus vannamei TaxID=6689 RepID=A0A3R7QPW9_PENVA|nr:hypothetical protein C7M84_007280 [Penaeus vannamei]
MVLPHLTPSLSPSPIHPSPSPSVHFLPFPSPIHPFHLPSLLPSIHLLLSFPHSPFPLSPLLPSPSSRSLPSTSPSPSPLPRDNTEPGRRMRAVSHDVDAVSHALQRKVAVSLCLGRCSARGGGGASIAAARVLGLRVDSQDEWRQRKILDIPSLPFPFFSTFIPTSSSPYSPYLLLPNSPIPLPFFSPLILPSHHLLSLLSPCLLLFSFSSPSSTPVHLPSFYLFLSSSSSAPLPSPLRCFSFPLCFSLSLLLLSLSSFLFLSSPNLPHPLPHLRLPIHFYSFLASPTDYAFLPPPSSSPNLPTVFPSSPPSPLPIQISFTVFSAFPPPFLSKSPPPSPRPICAPCSLTGAENDMRKSLFVEDIFVGLFPSSGRPWIQARFLWRKKREGDDG